jgi:hypothetical protein
MNTISSLMLGQRVLRLSLLSILWVGLATTIGFHSIRLHAACSPQIGYGGNSKCQQGDSCGEICGVTSAWCITETCTQNLTCAGSDQDIECITGGCLNGFQGNCTACGS